MEPVWNSGRWMSGVFDCCWGMEPAGFGTWQSYFPGVPQLLDFYHAAEHLHATAEAVWPEQAMAYRWCQQRLEQLRCGQESNFFAALQWLARRHTISDVEASPQRLLKYFEENRDRLDYPWALRHHLPIGSGQVESAARHIVQQRLKQSGMRWSDPGTQSGHPQSPHFASQWRFRTILGVSDHQKTEVFEQ
jgi:hypothetical protein